MLRIWQVSACKMEPRSGMIMYLQPPTHHPGYNLTFWTDPTRPTSLVMSVPTYMSVPNYMSVPTFMSVSTYYVCSQLLCLSPPITSVPTYHFVLVCLCWKSWISAFAHLIFNWPKEHFYLAHSTWISSVALPAQLVATLGSILDHKLD